eukprot:Skav201025  [mRNA]  locus=scaffold3386:28573:31860:+ [translate_table: standard]
MSRRGFVACVNGRRWAPWALLVPTRLRSRCGLRRRQAARAPESDLLHQDAAAVVTNCFFVSMYDAATKRWPVYDDFAMRFTMASGCLLLAYQEGSVRFPELMSRALKGSNPEQLSDSLTTVSRQELPVSSPVRVASMAERRPARLENGELSPVLPALRKQGLGQKLVTEVDLLLVIGSVAPPGRRQSDGQKIG